MALKTKEASCQGDHSYCSNRPSKYRQQQTKFPTAVTEVQTAVELEKQDMGS